MSEAVKCPVCNGSGKVAIDQQGKLDNSVIAKHDKECHGCSGKGWVELRK